MFPTIAQRQGDGFLGHFTRAPGGELAYHANDTPCTCVNAELFGGTTDDRISALDRRFVPPVPLLNGRVMVEVTWICPDCGERHTDEGTMESLDAALALMAERGLRSVGMERPYLPAFMLAPPSYN